MFSLNYERTQYLQILRYNLRLVIVKKQLRAFLYVEIKHEINDSEMKGDHFRPTGRAHDGVCAPEICTACHQRGRSSSGQRMWLQSCGDTLEYSPARETFEISQSANVLQCIFQNQDMPV